MDKDHHLHQALIFTQFSPVSSVHSLFLRLWRLNLPSCSYQDPLFRLQQYNSLQCLEFPVLTLFSFLPFSSQMPFATASKRATSLRAKPEETVSTLLSVLVVFCPSSSLCISYLLFHYLHDWWSCHIDFFPRWRYFTHCFLFNNEDISIIWFCWPMKMIYLCFVDREDKFTLFCWPMKIISLCFVDQWR